MAKNKLHGFDLVETQIRLEEWWLENVSSPVFAGGTYWPGGRSDSIRELLFQHWGEHGVDGLIEHEGVLYKADGCLDAPCPVLGVALALLEIRGYEETTDELQDTERLKLAAGACSISTAMRTELIARAELLAATPVSRAAAESETAGRPRRMLAQAVARHLRVGGFSYRAIGAFMASTEDAARHRSAASDDARSLSAVIVSLQAMQPSRPRVRSRPVSAWPGHL